MAQPLAVAWLLQKQAEKFTDQGRAQVAALTTRCPAFTEAQSLTYRCSQMSREPEFNELVPGSRPPRRSN